MEFNNPYNLKKIIPAKIFQMNQKEAPAISGGGKKKLEAPSENKILERYTEIDKKNWPNIERGSYIRYVNDKNELKHGCKVSDVIPGGLAVYAKIGNKWTNWRLKFTNIKKIYKFNAVRTPTQNTQQIFTFASPVNTMPNITPNIMPNIMPNITPNIMPNVIPNMMPEIPVASTNSTNTATKADLEVMSKKIDNLEIAQQYMEAEIKRLSNLLLKDGPN